MTTTETALYVRHQHGHQAVDVNAAYSAQRGEGFNQRLADVLTTRVGTMACAYLFIVIAFVGLLGVLNILPTEVFLLVSWASQTFIQLVMLPVIMVSQNVINGKQALQADQQFLITQKSYHDLDEMFRHLVAQDCELQTHRAILEEVLAYVRAHQPTSSLAPDPASPVFKRPKRITRKSVVVLPLVPSLSLPPNNEEEEGEQPEMEVMATAGVGGDAGDGEETDG